jgi:hypothetical protein
MLRLGAIGVAVFLAGMVVFACVPADAGFGPAIRLRLPAGFRATTLILADLNADGHADISVAGDPQNLAVFLNDGKGGFRSAKTATAGAHPVALAAAEMNGDGKIDLVAANHEMDYVTLLLGNGKGDFTARTLPVHSKPHPHAIAVGDVDGDGRPDIVVDSWREDRLMVLLGRQQWQAPGVSAPIGRKPYWNVAVADIDGDGAVDLIAPNAGLGTVSILTGNARAQFTHVPGSPFAAGPGPFSIAIGDLNGDRRPDVAVANYSGQASQTANDGLTWIRNDGARKFTPMPTRVATGRYSARLATGDTNKDGYADVAFTNTATNTVTIVQGSRNGPHQATNVTTMNEPHAVALGDVNGDQRADLAIASEGSAEVHVFLAR